MTIINPLPYNIANGQAIDATPVIADLNQIVSDVNANAAGLSQSNTFASGATFQSTLSAATPATSGTTQVPQAQQLANDSLPIHATSGPGATPFALRNRIINGAMAVDQRNAGAAQTITAGAALAYTVDRWWAACTGANVTGQQVAGPTGTPYVYQFTGAASVTGIQFGQRIEAYNSADMAGSEAVLSVALANSLLTSVTWTAYYANSADSFGTLASPTKTQIATGTFTVNGTLTRYQIPIAIPSAATTGIEIVFSVGAQTSGTWQVGTAQMESVGSNTTNPTATPFERSDIALEIARCYRYRQNITANARFPASAANQYLNASTNWSLMRAIPSTTLINTLTSANVSSYALSNINITGARFEIVSAAAGDTYVFNAIYALDSEL